MQGRAVAIVNPASRSGRIRHTWPRAAELLRQRLAGIEIRETCAPGSAGAIALDCAEEDVELLVVAGGDGTLREVATALAERGAEHSPELGLLPLGSGCDFARALGIPRDLEAAVDRLVTRVARPFDAGVIDYRAADGANGYCAFMNLSSCGLAGRLDHHIARQPRWLGGRGRYALAALSAILTESPQQIEIRIDGRPCYTGPLALCAVANGGFFGAGMHVAPSARPDDGLLDVVAIPGAPPLELLRRLPELYSGRHVAAPDTATGRGRVVELLAEPDTIWLDADGDTLGTLPARIQVLPGALRIRA
jgi:diacylglycerol kinase (ATP)